MATKIRLRRVGRKKQASFRIVVAGSMHARGGRVTETIGKYNPRTEPSFVEIDEKRALYWLGQGAEPSEKVEALFRQTGIMKKRADGVEGEGVVSIGSVDGKTKRPPESGKPSRKAEAAEAAAAAATVEAAPAAEAAPAEPAAAEEAVAEEAEAEVAEAEVAEAEVAEAEGAEAEGAVAEEAAPAEAADEGGAEKQDAE